MRLPLFCEAPKRGIINKPCKTHTYMDEKEVSDIKVNEEFPFHELRYVETNKDENKSQRKYLSCILHLTNQRRVTKRYCPLESLCSYFAEVMGKLKNGGQMANDFHLYKVGIRYLINPEYLVCLHPKGEKKTCVDWSQRQSDIGLQRTH